MRVALIGPASSIHLQQWAERLAASGLDVHVLSVHPSPGTEVDVTTHILPGGAPAGYVRAVPALRTMLGAISPTIVHVHYASGYGSLARMARIGVDVLSAWGSDVVQFPSTSWVHRRIIVGNLAQPKIVCATSRFLAERVLELGVPESRIRVVPFGVDVERFQPATRPDREQVTIGTVKSLRPVYGIDILIRAVAELRARLRRRGGDGAPDCRLVIAGAGPQRAELERLARSLEVGQYVSFLGPVAHEDVPAVLRTFDIFAVLSRSEGFGLAAAEASACGLPVVATEVGGLGEVMDGGRSGVLVAPDSPSAAADALLRLVLDRDLREALGRHGRAVVTERFSWERCTSAQLSVYDDVARERRRMDDDR